MPALVDEMADRLQIVGMRIRHAGRAAAKNLAVMLARAPVVLFFDDDDRAAADYLERHLAGHDARPDESVAVLGHTDWAPELGRTPLMHYLTDVDRMLFAYERLRDGQVLDWHGFWEGRVSCKRSLLLRHGLHDQRLGYSIDVELAWRLRGTGLRVVYDARAVSFMARPLDVDAFGDAVRSQGAGACHGGGVAPGDRDCQSPGSGSHRRAVAGEAARRRAAAPADRGAGGVGGAGDGGALPELHAAYRELFRALAREGCSDRLGSGAG